MEHPGHHLHEQGGRRDAEPGAAALPRQQGDRVSTFHSLGARLLRQYADRLNINRDFTIYDVDDRNKLVKEALDALGMDNVKFTPDRLAGAISKAKNMLLPPKQYEQQAGDFFTQTVAKVYYGYEKRLRAANGMDFDDLLYLPAMFLRHNEELRADLDAKFKFVLIDEYQDTNMAQYEIARKLSLHHPNLCVVGDPDQSIYKWRGSDIRNILDFERDFPNGEGHHARTQLPQHAAGDPARRQCAHRPQQAAEEEDCWSAPGRPATRCGCSPSTTGWTRPRASSSASSEAVAKERGSGSATTLCLRADQRPDAVAGVGVRQARGAVPDRQGAGVLRPQREQGRAGLPAAAGQPAGHGRLPACGERAAPRRRQSLPRPAGAVRQRPRNPAPRSRRAGDTGWPTSRARRSPASASSTPCSPSCGRSWRTRRTRSSARCWPSPATARCWWTAARTRTPTGWPTSRNSSPRPSSSTTRTPTARSATSWRTSPWPPTWTAWTSSPTR